MKYEKVISPALIIVFAVFVIVFVSGCASKPVSDGTYTVSMQPVEGEMYVTSSKESIQLTIALIVHGDLDAFEKQYLKDDDHVEKAVDVTTKAEGITIQEASIIESELQRFDEGGFYPLKMKLALDNSLKKYTLDNLSIDGEKLEFGILSLVKFDDAAQESFVTTKSFSSFDSGLGMKHHSVELKNCGTETVTFSDITFGDYKTTGIAPDITSYKLKPGKTVEFESTFEVSSDHKIIITPVVHYVVNGKEYKYIVEQSQYGVYLDEDAIRKLIVTY